MIYIAPSQRNTNYLSKMYESCSPSCVRWGAAFNGFEQDETCAQQSERRRCRFSIIHFTIRCQVQCIRHFVRCIDATARAHFFRVLASFVDSTEIRGEKLNIEMEMEKWTWTIFVWCFCSFTRHRIAWWIHKMAQEGERNRFEFLEVSICMCVCGAQQTQWCPLTISEYTSH